MKIDVFPHILPRRFFDRMLEIAGGNLYMQKRMRAIPVLVDLEERFRIMDRYEGYVQVLTLASPPIEALAGPDATPALARLANDGMAELVAKHPDRFPGFVASLPMHNPDAALRRTARATAAHHTGAVVPSSEGRAGGGLDQLGSRTEDPDDAVALARLGRRPLDYFKMFYGDTALFGARHAMECGLAFFGAERVLFGTDMPFDPEKGPGFIRDTIGAMERMQATPAEKAKIYEGNARRMLRLRLK